MRVTGESFFVEGSAYYVEQMQGSNQCISCCKAARKTTDIVHKGRGRSSRDVEMLRSYAGTWAHKRTTVWDAGRRKQARVNLTPLTNESPIEMLLWKARDDVY